MTLFFKEADVARLFSMRDAIDAVEEVFRWAGEGRIVNNPRSRVKLPAGFMHLMGAAVPPLGSMGFKAYTVFQGKARFLICLFSAENGEMLALMEADRLGQTRTGAASGVATKYMARPDATRVGVIGSGWQAKSQLEAVCSVRPVREVRVWSRSAERRSKFAREMSELVGIDVEPVKSPTECVSDAEIVITATTAGEPLFSSDLISEGVHINAMGSNSLVRREVDEGTVLKCRVLAVDSIEQAKLEAGEFLPLIEKGKLHWEQVVELGEIVADVREGRQTADDITFFKSLGVAMEDVAAANRVYRRALEEGWDQRVPIWD